MIVSYNCIDQTTSNALVCILIILSLQPSKNNINNSNMSSVNSNLLVLVYYNFRGKLQPIRNMLFYLDLPFV